MDDVALANYVAGCFGGPVEAGRIDRLCANLLGISCGIPIWLSAFTLEKLRRKHGDINFQHYRHMPSILLQGFVARGRKPTLVDLWWVVRCGRETIGFFVVLKATRKGEAYVETFHRIDLKEARRLLKRARSNGLIVREQANADALLKGGSGHISRKKKEVA
jgi:hypothetical protein